MVQSVAGLFTLQCHSLDNMEVASGNILVVFHSYYYTVMTVLLLVLLTIYIVIISFNVNI